MGPSPDERQAALEAETDRWAMLPPVEDWEAPPATFDDAATAQDVDARLRELARLRDGWEDVIGFCASAIRESGMHLLLGFTSFRHYVQERLQLSPRAVEQRAAFEKKVRTSPALEEARRQGLAYEKLRALSRLPEKELGGWIARARALTCIALRRRLDAEHERQMSVARRVTARLPLRVAAVVSAAIESARHRAGRLLPAARCLALIARHFVETWKPLLPRRTPSQRTRERDGGWCTVPGCSRPATDEHHVLYRSRGGSDDPANKTGVCGFHHHGCIHAGHLKVWGRAPDALSWVLGGKVLEPG
jgi:hypothetical protein